MQIENANKWMDITEASEYLHLQKPAARRVLDQMGAKVHINQKHTLYSKEVIDRYLDSLLGEQNEEK